MPEDLELKKVWKQIDAHAAEGMILASSTSSLPCSKFTSNLQHKAQCVVAHPVSHPYLV